MASQSTRHPSFKLLYVRTLIETSLHELMAGLTQEVLDKLPSTFAQMKQCEVEEVDQKDKGMLIEFAEGVLIRELETSLDELLIERIWNIPMVLQESDTGPIEVITMGFLKSATGGTDK